MSATLPGAVLVLVGLRSLTGAALAGPEAPLPPDASFRLGARYDADLVPPFFTEERDRVTVEADLDWRPAPPLLLTLEVDALRYDLRPDQAGQGGTRLGGGDIRLGTRLRLWTGPVEGGLSWEVKLPNAEDEPELGTDETDVRGLADASGAVGGVRLWVAGGVDIRGDPHRHRSQDVVPLVQAGAGSTVGPVTLRTRVLADLPTPREPGRVELALGVEGRCPWLSGGELLRGLTTAGPTWGARAWIGFGGGCRADDPSDDPSDDPAALGAAEG